MTSSRASLRLGHMTSSRLFVSCLIVVGLYHTRIVLSFHTDVVLLGGTGDLAQKYLWRSFFDLFSKYSDGNSTFLFYGCGRRHQDEGILILNNILEKNFDCNPDDKKCHENWEHFRKAITYHSLKTEQDFEDLGTLLRQRESGTTRSASDKNGVVFYAAIPPKEYSAISERLHRHCYLRSNRTWVRLVLEKPFGINTQTATEIAENVAKYFTEEEIYRIDHYLGKAVVQQVLPFR